MEKKPNRVKTSAKNVTDTSIIAEWDVEEWWEEEQMEEERKIPVLLILFIYKNATANQLGWFCITRDEPAWLNQEMQLLVI